MPSVRYGTTTIAYERYGDGYPILLIAPGGLASTIDSWRRATINPINDLAEDFCLIAMDQRNAGASFGPFPADDPWRAYADDQLAVMDALGYQHFHVFGCCIGGPYALRLALQAPNRVSALVLEQPMGLVPDNRDGWVARCHAWVTELASLREDLDVETGSRFIDKMWAEDFVSSCSRDDVATISAPTCVLPGTDDIHPPAIGHEIAHLIAGATTIEPWKDTVDHARLASSAIRQFLLTHTSE